MKAELFCKAGYEAIDRIIAYEEEMNEAWVIPEVTPRFCTTIYRDISLEIAKPRRQQCQTLKSILSQESWIGKVLNSMPFIQQKLAI
jgi:hypothetical protein